jgi:hypothetical protein
VDLANLGSESETCVGSHVRLIGVSISFKKNFYRLPFTPPLSGSPYWSFTAAPRRQPSPLRGGRGATPPPPPVHGGPDVGLRRRTLPSPRWLTSRSLPSRGGAGALRRRLWPQWLMPCPLL